MDPAELQAKIDELMRQYDHEEIDGATYAQAMIWRAGTDGPTHGVNTQASTVRTRHVVADRMTLQLRKHHLHEGV
ncbi:hypothetical protein [Streptomyces sp. NPDC007905]|uniref:hypothetical protein n=1 Tax=Streptomyces sp. NPDC007905 TaxID=3364788 RepID=UPI0036ED0A8E